jgi:hypothetical protein
MPMFSDTDRARELLVVIVDYHNILQYIEPFIDIIHSRDNSTILSPYRDLT